MSNTNINHKTAIITKMALLVAMNAVSAYIIIPLPFTESPLALQTVVVNLVGLLLTPRQAAITMIVYFLVGLVGLPVFTGGTAGPGKLFGPTGGYILGFGVAAYLIAQFKGREFNFKRYALVCIFIGIPVIYVLGAVQLRFFLHWTWMQTIVVGVLPFIPLDIVKCLVAVAIAKPLIKALSR